MSLPQHLQVINPNPSDESEDAVFTLFAKLVPELRMRIWEESLEGDRLVKIRVEPPPGYVESSPNSPESPPDDSPTPSIDSFRPSVGQPLESPQPSTGQPGDSEDIPLYSTANCLDKLISGRNYTATVDGSQIHSKLLHINRESRSVALKFYRVHLPCYFETKNSPHSGLKATLYLNPESDFIHLKSNKPVEYTFVDFLHDVKAYDPQDVGIVKLALSSSGMSHLQSLTSISEGVAKLTFVQCLSRLREIIWMAHSHTGRAIMGPIQGVTETGTVFNHSMPVKSITPRFDLLLRYPISIGPELKYVLTASSDPRQMRVQWQQFLTKWNIHPARPARERVAFAYEVPEYWRQVSDLQSARLSLEEEEQSWLVAQSRWELAAGRSVGKVPIEGPEELAKAVRPAIGFWLFPVEALGGLVGDFSRIKKIFDMTGHWPELALSRLF